MREAVAYFILLFGLILLFSQNVSDPDGPQGTEGSTTISSCYQTVRVESNKNIKLLRTGNANVLRLDDVSGVYDYKYFQIWSYSESSETWSEVDLTGQFSWSWDFAINPGTQKEQYVQIWKNFGQFTHHVVLPTGKSRFVLNFYASAPQGPGDPETPVIRYTNVGVEFVEVEDYIHFKPGNGKTCFDINDFSFEKIIDPEIEGFCGSFEDFRLKLPQGSVQTNGLPQGYEENVEQNKAGITLTPNNCNSPNVPQCNQAPANYPDPVPCRCITLNLECILQPCNKFFPSRECPSRVFSKEIEVCCQCDTRMNNETEYPE